MSTTLVPGELPPPVDAPPRVPQSVSRAQAELLADVLAYVDAIEDPTKRALAEVALSDTTEWRRDSPFLNEAAVALGLSPGELDDLFIAANSIQL